MQQQVAEWSGSPHPDAPDSFWIDDVTGEVVSAYSGVRLPAGTPVTDWFLTSDGEKSI